MQSTSASERTTLRHVRRWVKEGQRFPLLTCYDATTARWLVRGGIRFMLVGDTAAQMILGHDSTLPAKMPFMLEITAAVRRGAPQALIMADMPFGSYQCGEDQAVAHAMAFLSDAGADCVKLEVDDAFAPLVRRLNRAGVPVVAHIGSRPQQVRHEGACHSVGRTRAQADAIVKTAQKLLDHGAEMLLIEAVPNEVSQRVVELAGQHGGDVPVIGCGAGNACHGHVVVLHDLLGMNDWHPPFVKPAADIGPRISDAAAQWLQLVQSGQYLREDHPYKMQA